MRKLLHKLFGFEYCIVQYYDGEIVISRMKEISNGVFITQIFHSSFRLYEDGTTSKSYIKSWERLVF